MKKNRKELFKLLNYCKNDFEKKIIEGAIYGIISNYADSIYIANDYLNISNYNIISNYPANVAQREVERCRSMAYSLLLGNYPIILNDKYDFEGEANIKFIPAIINNNGKEYQLCLTFESSRSNIKSIENINYNLNKLGKQQLYPINLNLKNYNEYYYHLDCLLNFSTNNKIQYFESFNDFLNNYKKNGTINIEKNGLEKKTLSLIKNVFENIIFVDMNHDLLAANVIITNDGIVCSSNLKNKEEIKKNNKILDCIHPSFGGGGSHKCCSNVIKKNKSIKFEDYIYFLNYYNLDIKENALLGIKNELDRLKGFKF